VTTDISARTGAFVKGFHHGLLVVISDDTVNEYESQADFDQSRAANFILLR
jgi:hypothetical protein